FFAPLAFFEVMVRRRLTDDPCAAVESTLILHLTETWAPTAIWPVRYVPLLTAVVMFVVPLKHLKVYPVTLVPVALRVNLSLAPVPSFCSLMKNVAVLPAPMLLDFVWLVPSML